jgi:serine/threonine protein phosphatase 1
MRIYAVGDVHGRLDLLAAMARSIDADATLYPDRQHVEILIGDLIDRGPESAGVIDFVIARQQQRKLTVLRGNHEQYMRDALMSDHTIARWMAYGGEAALRSYGIEPRENGTLRSHADLAESVRHALPKAHRNFFSTLPDHVRHHDYLFVHAGLRPGIPLEQQSPEDLVMIRHGFLDDETDHGFVVVHGHTPVPEPQVRTNRIGIDTKAYESGRLTCLIIDGEDRTFMQT